MMGNSFIRVLPIDANEGRCRHCRQPVIWVRLARKPGEKAAYLPFNGRPMGAREERDPITSLRIQFWPRESKHECAEGARAGISAPRRGEASR